MRSSELALHLPHEIAELRASSNAIDKRRISAVHSIPVDAEHSFCPEIIALQPPRFSEHLTPFFRGHYRDARSREIEPSALAPRFGRRARIDLTARADHAQLRTRA